MRGEGTKGGPGCWPGQRAVAVLFAGQRREWKKQIWGPDFSFKGAEAWGEVGVGLLAEHQGHKRKVSNPV